MSRWQAPLCALILVVCPATARAQMGRGLGGGGRMGRSGEQKPDKPKQVEQGQAPKAPKKKKAAPAAAAPREGARPIERQVNRPMTIGLPIVTSRKCLSSRGRCQGNAPSWPIARLLPIAATSVILLPFSMVRGPV